MACLAGSRPRPQGQRLAPLPWSLCSWIAGTSHVSVPAMEGRPAATSLCDSLALPSGSLDNPVSLSLPCAKAARGRKFPWAESRLCPCLGQARGRCSPCDLMARGSPGAGAAAQFGGRQDCGQPECARASFTRTPRVMAVAPAASPWRPGFRPPSPWGRLCAPDGGMGSTAGLVGGSARGAGGGALVDPRALQGPPLEKSTNDVVLLHQVISLFF